jgi:serine/threonine protein kinase
VYAGEWATQKVALKTLHDDRGDWRVFLEEIKISQRLRSPAIVSTFGVTVIDERVYVVMELCERGSLLNWLRSDTGND